MVALRHRAVHFRVVSQTPTASADPAPPPGTAAPAVARSRRMPRSLRLLVAGAILVPLAFLAGGAWFDHRRLMAEAEADVLRLSAIAREHALKVVETNALVLDRVEDRVRGLGWEAIAAQGEAIHRDLKALDDAIAQISAVHLVGPDGILRVISTTWPTPRVDLTRRDYWQRIQGGEPGLVFGQPVAGRLSGVVSFIMARRRAAPDGGFDGLVVGSILPGYFQAQWHAMDPDGRAGFALIRTDGQVLAAHPRGASDLIPTPDPASVPRGVGEALYLPVVEHLGERGEWLTAFRRVGEHPLVVSVTVSLDQVRGTWLANTAAAAALCLLASLALGVATLLAIRRWRSEQATLARLERTAAELREEIARREAAEEGLHQAQRLEALGRLTGGIAHDFNNLLTAILGTVELLDRHLGAADERTRRLLGIARDAVGRGARLTTSLLAFARRQSLRPAPLDANALVGGFAPLIQRAVGDAVTLILALEPELPACRADVAQLEAAVLNLAINARDAMPEGGTLTIRTALGTLGPAELAGNPDARPGPHVAITVADTGTGMTAEVRQRAFEPFFTTKPVGKGTGLGLSQVFGAIRQLGGHVAIDSAPGQGTRVTLHLPVASAFAGAGEEAAGGEAPAAGRAPAAPPFLASAPVVLVVEDDERVREVAVETLRQSGFRVLAAPDGAAALALLERGARVDVVFSDIAMPGGLDGVELGRAARRLRPELPVLLATGFAGPEPRDHGFEVLAKPYALATLVRRIGEMAAETTPAE